MLLPPAPQILVALPASHCACPRQTFPTLALKLPPQGRELGLDAGSLPWQELACLLSGAALTADLFPGELWDSTVKEPALSPLCMLFFLFTPHRQLCSLPLQEDIFLQKFIFASGYPFSGV